MAREEPLPHRWPIRPEPDQIPVAYAKEILNGTKPETLERHK